MGEPADNTVDPLLLLLTPPIPGRAGISTQLSRYVLTRVAALVLNRHNKWVVRCRCATVVVVVGDATEQREPW